MTVKRYAHYGALGMREHHNGEYVPASDYDALREEVELQHRLEEAAHLWRCDEDAECDSASTLALCDALDALQAWREGNDETR